MKAFTMHGKSSESLDEKVAHIRSAFGAFIGAEIHGYQTAQLLGEDGEWSNWADLPIRLMFSDDRMLSIAWSKFDELWLAGDSSLPFPVEGTELRWVHNTVKQINAAINARIRSVQLGRGQFSIEGTDIEIWTRLLIQLDSGWLEIFNALDENGYLFHPQHPTGKFVSCF